MSFWDEVRKGLEEGAQALKKGAEVVAEKTEEAAKVAKLRYDIHAQRQSIKKTFTELGGHVFELAEQGHATVWGDEQVSAHLAAIREARQKISELEKEMAAVSTKDSKKEAGESAAESEGNAEMVEVIAEEPVVEEEPPKKRTRK